jgi:hypothetical protein
LSLAFCLDLAPLRELLSEARISGKGAKQKPKAQRMFEAAPPNPSAVTKPAELSAKIRIQFNVL